MIRGIIFDCYGVLVHGSLDYLRALTPSEKRQEFADLAHASDNGFISRADYLEGVGGLIGRTPAQIQEIINQQEVKNPEMLAYVASLHGTYKTAMLSNVGRGAINRLFAAEELDTLFDAVVLSSEVGMTKPNPEAYQYAASLLGLSPEECIMIDDIPFNVEGAEAIGMNGVLFETVDGCQAAVTALIKEHNA